MTLKKIHRLLRMMWTDIKESAESLKETVSEDESGIRHRIGASLIKLRINAL